MFFSLFLILTVAVPYGLAIESPLDDALLKGNWKESIELLKRDDTKTNDPVVRLIMGHACLATNRNNESMLLFLSVKEQDDIRLWSEWTDSLLRKHPRNPMALYLLGDARARSGKLKEAEDMFTRALKVNGGFTLAYNARGVVRVLNNSWDEALIDLYQATALAPNLADAHANLGTYWVLKESSEGALESFNHALTINPKFALAYNGRGSGYFGKGEFENAAMDFSMASQLNPLLVMAEINQGFASTYAAKLVTLASMERKPGMSLESINQQYPSLLKEQEQQLLNMLPSQKDQEFWEKMHAFPALSQDQIGSLVKEYGPQKVQVGGLLKIQELKSQITTNYQKSRPYFTDKINFFNDASSFSFYFLGLDKNAQEFWKEPFSGRAPEISKAMNTSAPPAGHIIFCSPGVGPSGAFSQAGHIALSLGGGKVYEMPANDQTGKLARAPRITTWDKLIQNYPSVHSVPIPGATSSDIERLEARAYEVVKNPTGYYSEPYNVLSHNCIQSVKRLGRDAGLDLGDPNWKISEHPWQFYTWLRIKGIEDTPVRRSSQQSNSLQQQIMTAGELLNIETKLNVIGAIPAASPSRQLPAQIPGYYTFTDRPLTEISAIASMVDKTVTKSMYGSPRRALVVAQDPFRANLQQQELKNFVFDTRFVPQTFFVLEEAKRLGADVILGIRGTTEMKAPQIGHIPIDDTSEKHFDYRKAFGPPFPPDKGGGAAGIPHIQPQIKQNWDWGKAFVPTYPKGAPGGISTEEIARAFVDKGNWPVLTSFGLFYGAASFTSENGSK